MIIMYIMLLESHVSVLDKNFVVYRSLPEFCLHSFTNGTTSCCKNDLVLVP